MNDTLAGSLRGMGSAWESLQITIGKLFLPVVRAVVDALTGLLRLLDKAAQSKVGAAVLKMAAALATGVVAVTGFSAGLWAISRAAPFVAKALLPIKTALLGLGWPGVGADSRRRSFVCGLEKGLRRHSHHAFPLGAEHFAGGSGRDRRCSARSRTAWEKSGANWRKIFRRRGWWAL